MLSQLVWGFMSSILGFLPRIWYVFKQEEGIYGIQTDNRKRTNILVISVQQSVKKEESIGVSKNGK